MALLILRVPLAFPLALLTFFATFIPLIGAPIALFVATLVALAARGPLIALLVLALIVVIGQIEGHLLQPLIMSRAVNLHPLAVALTVASGTVLAGVIGAVVAVPLAAVAWTVWTALTSHTEGADESAELEGHFRSWARFKPISLLGRLSTNWLNIRRFRGSPWVMA